MSGNYFLRQLLLCSGPWTIYFMHGMCTGLPTVLIPQLRRANQTIDDETASWLLATHTYSGIPWLVIQSVLITTIGRKKSFIVACISGLIGFSILLSSTNITHILIAEIFNGALSAAYLTTCITILTECTSAKNRGIFLTIKSATFSWGILVANAIGTFFRYQNVAVLGLVCSFYTFINVTVWPESPLFLASKGRLEECASAHRWLKGDGHKSERELENLLKFQEENRKLNKTPYDFRNLLKTICCKQFFKPIILSYLLVCLYSFSGKLVCAVYAIDILKKITSSESTAYFGMLILDGVTVCSMYFGCFICRVLRRRVMLLGFSSVGVIFLIVISVYLYLAKLCVIEENKYVSIFLLSGYSISISCGPMIMSTSILGELLPLQNRIMSLFFVAVTFKVTNGTFLKISPIFFKNLLMCGTFALYAVLSIVFLILIYFYLPETKGLTIQEIDGCLNGKNFSSVESTELMSINVSKTN